MLVSVIVPVYNAADYLSESLECLLVQTYRPLEVVFVDDASSDGSLWKLQAWKPIAVSKGISVVIASNFQNRGPGYTRNEAVRHSSGRVICHFDADDKMHPERIALQVDHYQTLSPDERDFHLMGTGFDRTPPESTPYYTEWLNKLCTPEQLHQQCFRECTLICPSWMYSRAVFDRIAAHRCSSGAFVESSEHVLAAAQISRVPEDLYFFLDHLLLQGKLSRVSQSLITYRYTPNGWSLGSKRLDLQKVRARYLEVMVLDQWPSFQIWGYGKDGRKFLKLIAPKSCAKVSAFLDVDDKKISLGQFYCSEARKNIPIKHFRDSTGDPIIICVASKRTLGLLEANIAQLGLREGLDFYHFA